MAHRLILMNDFDGNILDTMEAHGILAAKCINKYFGMPLDEAEARYHGTTGVPFDRQLEMIFPTMKPEDRKACAEEYHRRKLEEVYDACELFPEMREALPQIRRLGFPVSVSTSTETPLVTRLLSKNNVLPYFDAVWGREYGSKPQHVERANDLYKPEIVLFTGDSMSDVEICKKAKSIRVITIGRTGKKKGMLQPDALFDAGASHVTESFLRIPAIMKSYIL